METTQMPRGSALLQHAAEDLEAGNMLLNGAFLREHNVTADEALGLADTVAGIIRGYLRLDPELQAMITLLGVDTEQEIPSWLALQNAYKLRAWRRMKSGEDAEEDFFAQEGRTK